ncbi:polyprenyl synthetase family protein [Mangrovihabitans endophyticus]|uniref:Geranylgeranyl pyrophosphate synthase n=1 Tax=Mangrovihabitans endophyticus TaxID=1751298 RepID=A0A8J3FPU5_9ACTN|nr:polyprenyl synthetase family protein [Mangrovihabitans endophyticus]GGK95520.1 geranylgeranyl pyrophosphate synthase [Mangrovihabitans endophyticus]
MPNDILTPVIPRQSVHEDGLVPAVEGTLADFLASQIAQLDAVDPALGGFARTTRDLVLRQGKRLRPTFAYWGWRGFAGPREPVGPILPAIAALEMMHAFALVHDDVMDASATRRGAPTAHRLLAAQHIADGRRGDPERFGDAAAILVGDLCLVWADQLLAHATLPTSTLFAARARYDRMRAEAVAGQYLDMLGEHQPEAWTVDRALLVARNKTASYTVQRPLQFGLALAGTDSAVEDAYDRYGTAIGEAFQLCDDLLGVYGDPAVTGKPAGDDLRTGKPTALLMLARQLATPAQLAELTLDPAGVVNPADGSSPLRIAQVISDTGAPDRIRGLIRQRVDEGVAALSDAPLHDDARAALVDLAVTATHRAA